MQAIATRIPGVLIFEPTVFDDARGFFFESFHQQRFDAVVGRHYDFVQDNHSQSRRGVLRGLHYQIQQPQGKLARVAQGRVLDVAVDIRMQSPTFGQWLAVELSAHNRRQLWLPPGLAHGFVTFSETADFLYKATDYYAPAHERCIRWNDTQLAIDWRLGELDGITPQLSAKDLQGVALADAECFG